MVTWHRLTTVLVLAPSMEVRLNSRTSIKFSGGTMANIETSASRTELTDSLLHTNWKRVMVGLVCGLAAGMFMLILTTFFGLPDDGKLWWIQLLGSVCYGGQAMAYAAPGNVFMTGFIVHFAIAGLCGLIMGKATRSGNFSNLIMYGIVLGGLCWLASNMFAPDFVDQGRLHSFGQWARVFVFVPFGACLGFFMALASKALKV